MRVFTRAMADRRNVLAWWLLGLVLYCVMIVAVWPVVGGNEEFNDLYAEMPEAIQAMFGAEGFTDFTSPTGFLNAYVYSMILPFILTGLAISMGAALLAGEEEDGLIDLVLSYPVSRRRLVLEKALAVIVAVVILGLGLVLVLVVAREPVDLDIGAAGLASATLGSALFGIAHGLLAMAVGAWRGVKSLASGAAWGVALAGYLVNIVANIDDSLESLRFASPLYWATAGKPLEGNWPSEYLVLAAAAVVLGGAAVVLFERHDLSS